MTNDYCPFVRMHQRGSYWTDFCEIWYRIPLRESVVTLPDFAIIEPKRWTFYIET
jgi:hypothetical protein